MLPAVQQLGLILRLKQWPPDPGVFLDGTGGRGDAELPLLLVDPERSEPDLMAAFFTCIARA